MHFDMMMQVLILEIRDYARNSEMEETIIRPLVEEQIDVQRQHLIDWTPWDVLKHWSSIGAFCLHVEASPGRFLWLRVGLTPLYVQKET
jgi:hypothetical protein